MNRLRAGDGDDVGLVYIAVASDTSPSSYSVMGRELKVSGEKQNRRDELIYRTRNKTQNWAGETIGIIVLDCEYPYIPGNVANATTFDFPVRYAVVEGVDNHKLIFNRDPSALEPFKVAARKLQNDGVKAITGACGFMALFQNEIASSVDVPVFMSSLLQVPFIHRVTNKRVGIVTADKSMLLEDHLTASGIHVNIPLAITGMEDCNEFKKAIFYPDGTLDDDAIRKGVVARVKEMHEQYPDLGAILLECSDLPPYAHDIQLSTGLPVYDFNTMINYVHSSLVRRPYVGYM